MRLIDAVTAAKEAIVAKDDDAAVKFLNNLSFSIPTSKKIIELIQNEENTHARTAWSMVQGITAHARSVTATEDRADMERVAGNIWSRVTRNAA
jgi:Fe-S cluster assembly scaffold protein SufB